MKRGAAAEQLAADYLQRQGLKLLQRNYRCRYGEIDLIMQEGATVVFVEVRQRSSSEYGGAAASIVAAKQAKIVTTARHYLASLRSLPSCRFDVLLLQGGTDASMEWLKNAFSA